MSLGWIQVTIYTTSAGIEPVSGRLYQLGITGVEIEDEAEFYTFLEENRQSWDYVDEDLVKQMAGETRIKIYVSDNAAGHDMLHAVQESLRQLKEMDEKQEYGSLKTSLSNMDEEDWANNWKQYFKPLTVGEKILICPEWETVEKDSGRIVFSIDPGMSFGTGSHHTTQLCIEELEQYITPETGLLDLGCGSGILSIISLLLGAKDATAVDIDPNAVDIAYRNAEKNGVDRTNYRVLAGDIITDTNLLETISDRKYPVVVANIVADVIIALKDIVPILLDENGIFITSGIIAERKDDVITAYENSAFKIRKITQKGDWVAIVFEK